MGEPVIDIKGLSKTYRSGFRRRSVQAVRNLDLRVEKGQVVAFVGPNGAGKTTTIYLMLGLLNPDGGNISIFGLPPRDPESRRRIGFQSEIFYTYPFLRCEQALQFYSELSGLPLHETAPVILEYLDRLGLGDDIYRKVKGFSKGMIQRLGLVQALLHRPELLILDEPTTGLDPEGRKTVADIILEERDRGTTVFLSSHILSDVERTCDQMVIIKEGEAVLSAEISALSSSADTWAVEVLAPSSDLVETLGIEGIEVSEVREGAIVFRSPKELKEVLLRRLLDMQQEIGSVQRISKSLEDIYLEHVGAVEDA